MRRRATAALLAVGLGLLVSGCGVQSTGVNVAQTEPFMPSGGDSSQTPSQAAAQYPMVLFFKPSTPGLPRQTVRYVSKPVTGIDDLLQQLKIPVDENLVTLVPQDLKLIPTSNAHEYQVSSGEALNYIAEEQLSCTFDYYWRQHPDKGAGPSANFVQPNGRLTGWDDCPWVFGSAPDDLKPSQANGY